MKEEEFDIKDAIKELGILLSDESEGLIQQMLRKDYDKEYEQFDTITAWDCFCSQVNRVNKVIELHDQLSICNEKDLTFLISQDVNDFDLEFRETIWLTRLQERIRNELKERKGDLH